MAVAICDSIRRLLSTPGLLVPIVIERDGADRLTEIALDETRPDTARSSMNKPWFKKLF